MKEKEIPIPRQPGIYKIVRQTANGTFGPTGSFRVRWREKVNGKWTTRSATFHDFDEARNFRNKPKALRVAEKQELIASQSTFTKVYERFINHKTHECHLAASTLEQYRKLKNHFQLFLEFQMENITSKTVDAWCNLVNDPEYLSQQKVSRTRYKKEYTLLSTVLKYYREYENEAYSVPLLTRHRKRLCTRARNAAPEIKYLTESQRKSFIAEIAAVDKIFQEIAIVQSQTGMRIGEVLPPEKRHVSFERNEVAVKQHLYFERKADAKTLVIQGTKGGPSRVIPLTTVCRSVFQGRFTKSKSQKVFEMGDDWITYRQVQHAYDFTFRMLGFEHSGTHTLRHTFAVEFLDRTKDIHALQQLLGHSDLKTTQIYAKYTNAAVLRAFDVFNEGQQSPPQAEASQRAFRLGFDSEIDSEPKFKIVCLRN